MLPMEEWIVLEQIEITLIKMAQWQRILDGLSTQLDRWLYQQYVQFVSTMLTLLTVLMLKRLLRA